MKTGRPISYDEALLRAADLCSRAERCRSEIADRFLRKGLPAADVRRLLDELAERRFLDDSRFARAFTSDKVRFSAWGRRKIRAALALKRIPPQAIAEALDGIDPEEYGSAAARSAAAAARGLDLGEYADRVKLFRRLAARGFEPDIINAAIRDLR